jgi:hypothetical protein
MSPLVRQRQRVPLPDVQAHSEEKRTSSFRGNGQQAVDGESTVGETPKQRVVSTSEAATDIAEKV